MRLSQTPRARSRTLAGEGGFSMAVVMVVLLIGGLLVTAAFAAANSDLPFSRGSQDRKSAYAAAEAGVSYYSFRLTQDNDYWTKCTTVPDPSPTEPSPVNQRWGGGTGADPRRWRTLPDATSQYTIELLPAPGYQTCQVGVNASMVDPRTGSFRIRVTGRPRVNGAPKRSLNLTYRRKSFLDYIYFTGFEGLDPSVHPVVGTTSVYSATEAAANCADRMRSQRPPKCRSIQFIDADRIKGPLHTNDENVLVCRSPVFGEISDDVFEVTGGDPGFRANCTSATPSFTGPRNHRSAQLQMPQTNQALAREALPNYSFAGKTWIRFNGTQMSVRNVNRNSGQWYTLPMPENGVIYVAAGGSCFNTNPQAPNSNLPPIANYAESNGCANVYLSGTYGRSVTVGAANDIIVGGTGVGERNFTRSVSGDFVAGLIADNFVRVHHRVNRAAPTSTNPNTYNDPETCTEVDQPAPVRIDAAILTLQHSFMVDNYACGTDRGTLTVDGAIAQKYRGAVGQSGSPRSGYVKDYRYDRRLRYRSPPFFIEPVAAAWRIVRRNEQVPAT